MKRAVLIIFLIGFCKVFASFEFDILGNLTASTGITIEKANQTSGNTMKARGTISAIFGASLQIGNQYPISRKLKLDKPMEAPIMNNMNIEKQDSTKELKAVSVLLDIKIEQETIALVQTGSFNLSSPSANMYKMSGLNLGAGITTKFIIGRVNSLVPRDTILGFGVGAKFLVNLIGVDIAILRVGSFPVITPYIDFFVEQRFFVARKFALVGGINIGADILIPQNELSNLFDNLNFSKVYPSFNIGVNLGMHFGN